MKTQVVKVFNKIFYNLKVKKKSWRIRGIESDPRQIDGDNFKLDDIDLYLTVSQEENTKEIIFTFSVDNKEYSFIMYDEIIKFINELNKA